MKNVNLNVTPDGILTIQVNLKERHGRSASGKTEIVATSEGNQSLPGFPEIKLGLNLYTK